MSQNLSQDDASFKSVEFKQDSINRMAHNFSDLIFPNKQNDILFDTTAPREAGEFMSDEIQTFVKAVIDNLGRVPTKEEMIIELTKLGLMPFEAVDIVNTQLIFDEDVKASSEAKYPEDWTEQIKAKEGCGCVKDTEVYLKAIES